MLRSLLLMAFMELMGFSMLMPVGPYFAIKELGLKPSNVGVVLTCHAIAQLIGAGVCGRLSDCFGRYPLLLACFAWSTAGMFGMYFVEGFWQLLALRTLQGLSGGTTPICHSYILDVVPVDERPLWMGVFGCVAGTAFVGGCCVGLLLVVYSLSRRVIFVIAGCCALMATIFGAISLRESLPAEKRRPLWSKDALGITSANDDLEVVSEGLVGVWTIRFFASLSQGLLFATYAFLINDLFGWTDFHFGAILATTGIIGAIMQLTVFPVLGQQSRMGPVLSMACGCACGALSFLLYPRNSLILHTFAGLCFTVSGALIEPAVPVLVGFFAGERHLGFANGMAGAARSAAAAVAPVIGGYLYEQHAAYPYLAGTILFVGSGLCVAHVASSPAFKGPDWQDQVTALSSGFRSV